MLKFVGWSSIAVVCLIWFIGCSDDPTSPPKTADIAVSFNLTPVSDGNSRDLVAHMEVEHRGGLAINYHPCGLMFAFKMEDELGNELIIYDPGYSPECPPWDWTLRAGETLKAGLGINGRIWDSQGAEVSLSPGRYTLLAHFSYSIAGSDEGQYWTREIGFDWE